MERPEIARSTPSTLRALFLGMYGRKNDRTAEPWWQCCRGFLRPRHCAELRSPTRLATAPPHPGHCLRRAPNIFLFLRDAAGDERIWRAARDRVQGEVCCTAIHLANVEQQRISARKLLVVPRRTYLCAAGAGEFSPIDAHLVRNCRKISDMRKSKPRCLYVVANMHPSLTSGHFRWCIAVQRAFRRVT